MLEARKGVEVVERLVEHVGFVAVLAVLAPLRHERVDDERRLGQRQRIDALELAQLEHRAGLLLARRRRLGPRCGGVILVRHFWGQRAWLSVAQPGAGELDRCLAGDGAECEPGAAIGAMSSLLKSDWRGKIVSQEVLPAKCPSQGVQLRSGLSVGW